MAKVKVKDKDAEDKYTFLRKFNLIMGFFHLVQAGLMFYLSNDFSLAVTTSYLKASGQGFPTTSTENWFELMIGPAVAMFLLLSAIAHFTVAAPRIYNWYKEKLSKGINYARWYEYALSSSIMIVVIAMLSGVFDFWLLFVMFALNAVMNLMGLMMELHNQTTKKTDWTSFIIGCFAGLVPWVVIFVYFFSALSSSDQNIPDFVYWIVVSLFITFNIFPINMVLQYKKVGPWKDYLFGEKVYIFLSLFAKTLLAWQVFGGTLRPQ